MDVLVGQFDYEMFVLKMFSSTASGVIYFKCCETESNFLISFFEYYARQRSTNNGEYVRSADFFLIKIKDVSISL